MIQWGYYRRSENGFSSEVHFSKKPSTESAGTDTMGSCVISKVCIVTDFPREEAESREIKGTNEKLFIPGLSFGLHVRLTL